MIVAIVTFRLPQPAALADMKRVFSGTAPKYLNLDGLLRKNYWLSEDGLRAGGIYVWESKARRGLLLSRVAAVRRGQVRRAARDRVLRVAGDGRQHRRPDRGRRLTAQ